ncbi:MAG: phytanoyl-CoA dioxygenase family protein [Verrucomicrobiae bacterium]|nr:phytanoyl-CoA dioxygenase family protein [Verrucomicrobiae bacterium]
MVSKSEVEQFKAQGFLKSGRVLSDAQIEVLREDLDRVIRDRDKGGRQPVLLRDISTNKSTTIWQVVNIWETSEPFKELIHNKTIVEEVSQLIEAKELRVWHDQIQYKPAGVGGVSAWHQDWPYWPILSGPFQVTAWVALDDVDEGNGCMSMVTGSHEWGKQIDFLHQITDFKAMPERMNGHSLNVKLCPVGRGEVHYHHGLTWHGSHANTSGRPRRALAIHIMTERTRYVESGNHPMKPFVVVADGETLKGEHFPLLWSASQ